MFILNPHNRLLFVLAFFIIFVSALSVAFAQGSPDGNSISAPSASAPKNASDTFFDASNLVPQGEIARKGPNAINPASQPASRFVVVRKSFEKDSQTAQIVAAERALSLGRFDSALQILDVLYDRNKKNPRIVMNRAIALQKLSRFDEAMRMYEVCLLYTSDAADE